MRGTPSHQVVALLLLVVGAPLLAAGFNDAWRAPGDFHGDWTLRPPESTAVPRLEGENVCTKQEA